MAMPQMYMAKPKDIHESDRQGTVGDEDYQSACKLPFNVLQKDSLSPPISAILILAGPFVHENLFLGDMAAGRTTFCSLLQASAMLTNACEIGPSERLWELESLPGKNTITNVQAAMIIAYHMSTNSLEQVGAVYAKRAREMGEKLDLFEPNYCGLGMNMNEARVFTAWALFSWQAMFSFYQSRRPYFRETPRIPLYLHRKDIYISPLGGSIVV